MTIREFVEKNRMERRAGSWAEEPYCAICAQAPAIQLEPVGRELWYVCAGQDCLDQVKSANGRAKQ